MGAFFQELFHVGLYKRTQGRITRQVTFAAVAIILALGCYRLQVTLLNVGIPKNMLNIPVDYGLVVSYAVAGCVALLGAWIAYRLVNVPIFADFLIAVEAEMNKVSWPTRNELVRSSIVVLLTIFVLASVLFMFDLIWNWVFTVLNVIPKT